MIPFETMGPCRKCGDFIKPCRCNLMEKAELLEKMAEALEDAKNVIERYRNHGGDSLATLKGMSVCNAIEQVMQEYLEMKNAK